MEWICIEPRCAQLGRTLRCLFCKWTNSKMSVRRLSRGPFVLCDSDGWARQVGRTACKRESWVGMLRMQQRHFDDCLRAVLLATEQLLFLLHPAQSGHPHVQRPRPAAAETAAPEEAPRLRQCPPGYGPCCPSGSTSSVRARLAKLRSCRRGGAHY